MPIRKPGPKGASGTDLLSLLRLLLIVIIYVQKVTALRDTTQRCRRWNRAGGQHPRRSAGLDTRARQRRTTGGRKLRWHGEDDVADSGSGPVARQGGPPRSPATVPPGSVPQGRWRLWILVPSAHDREATTLATQQFARAPALPTQHGRPGNGHSTDFLPSRAGQECMDRTYKCGSQASAINILRFSQQIEHKNPLTVASVTSRRHPETDPSGRIGML
jgi:hypothetical protein